MTELSPTARPNAGCPDGCPLGCKSFGAVCCGQLPPARPSPCPCAAPKTVGACGEESRQWTSWTKSL